MIEIQWQQLLTHALGFALTIWVLKKYAWKPLLALMEERRNKIIEEFKAIDEEKAKVARLTAEYEAKLRDIESERRVKLVEAVDDGKKVAAEIKANAQKEVKDLHAKAKADLERDIDKAKVQLRDEMVRITMTAAEKVIREKLDDAKHRELIGKYIKELENA
ncbi:MAG: F0F1 ATP synthase subunit B [candidate division Zixibacteria bacterium]|nr:F0F1 ATP synthase subunit B [candidate division Zixibacteria bacterium]MDD5426931.1 F0F1 ATP synthase subunit B [candidate division Zixibacteria bacterium]